MPRLNCFLLTHEPARPENQGDAHRAKEHREASHPATGYCCRPTKMRSEIQCRPAWRSGTSTRPGRSPDSRAAAFGLRFPTRDLRLVRSWEGAREIAVAEAIDRRPSIKARATSSRARGIPGRAQAMQQIRSLAVPRSHVIPYLRVRSNLPSQSRTTRPVRRDHLPQPDQPPSVESPPGLGGCWTKRT